MEIVVNDVPRVHIPIGLMIKWTYRESRSNELMTKFGKVVAEYPTYFVVECVGELGDRFKRTIDKIDILIGAVKIVK